MGATNNSGVHRRKEERTPQQREQTKKPVKSNSNRILLI